MRATLFALFLTACVRPAPPPATTPSEDLAVLFDAIWEARLADDPVLASREGRKTRYGEWTPYTEEYVRAAAAREAGFLEQVKAVDASALTPSERLTVRIYEDEVALRQDAVRWWRHGYPVDQMNGVHAGAASFLMDVHRVDDVGDAEAYVARLEGLDGLLRDVVAEMEAREALGVLPPRFVFPKVISDCHNLTTGAPFGEGPDSPLMADFRAKVAKLPEEEQARLIGLAETALRDRVGPAYARLVAVLERQQAVASDDDGAWKLPDGAAYYAFQIRSVTSTDMTAAEVHALGLSEVARIHAEMDAARKKIGFEGDLQAFFEHLRTDPKFYYDDSPEGRAAYLARVGEVVDEMRGKLPELFITLPKAELVVKAVEPYREASAGKAFYDVGAPDGSRPGIYYANLYRMADMPKWQLESLAYHEAIPGHHMQLSLAQEIEGLPEIRSRADRTAYIEGWGLYSERVPVEIGLYTDPYSDFGRLSAELWRASRLVVDTGIHDQRWTRQQAIDWLVANTPGSEGDSARAIERYIVMPGQATAYTIGFLRILELREHAKAELGDAFDLREFHDVVLTSGPVPLDVLGEIVDAWIEEKR